MHKPFCGVNMNKKEKGNTVLMRDNVQPVAIRYASHVTTENMQHTTTSGLSHGSKVNECREVGDK
jgi:hypothetical protein